jgi:TRAP-type C4-dicarboxylate transport system permease small subunit
VTAGGEIDFATSETSSAASPGLLGRLNRWLDRINAVLMALSGVAAGTAGLVLTWEVAGRYFFQIPSFWQDELSIFLLVGATFFSAAWIQARRGHVGIDALRHILPPAADRIRAALADGISLAFCLFFTWKCWTLFDEAWEEDQITSTPWGPPLTIPYGVMALGMSLLSLQLLLQVVGRFATPRSQ